MRQSLSHELSLFVTEGDTNRTGSGDSLQLLSPFKKNADYSCDRSSPIKQE
jgi:hypothetical protein